MTIAYIDTSVFSVLFREQDEKRAEYTLKVLNKYSISEAVFTNRLFLELIGQGKVRNRIVNNSSNKSTINEWKRKYIATASPDIKNYFISLWTFFDKNFRESLPQRDICAIAKNYYEKFPFKGLFLPFQDKLLSYAQELSDDGSTFDSFISYLVEESVIKYLVLDDVHKYIKLEDIVSFLLSSSPDLDSLKIMIFMTAFKQDTEGKAKKKLLVRLKNDFADIEPPGLLCHGSAKGGDIFPVTLFTLEKKDLIEQRLLYFLGGLGEVIKSGLYQDERLSKLCIGRCVLIDPEDRSFQELDITKLLKRTSC